MWKSVCVHHARHDFCCSDCTDAGEVLLELYQIPAPCHCAETPLVLPFALAVEINILLQNLFDERGTLPLVPVTELERLPLIENAHSSTNNIVVAAHQRPQFVECAATVIDLREKSGSEQLTEFPRIDLVGLRSVAEQPVFERIADQDALRIIEQLEVQPVCTSRFLNRNDRTALQIPKVHFEILKPGRLF